MPTCLVHTLPYRADPAAYFSVVCHAPGAVLLDAGRPAAERGRYDLGVADAQLGLYAWALITDHHLGTSQLMFHPTLSNEQRQSLIDLFDMPQTPTPTPTPFRLTGAF